MLCCPAFSQIKPNEAKTARVFNAKSCVEQMTYAGVFEAVKIRKSGYPFRLVHRRFAARYKPLLPKAGPLAGNDREKCQTILKALNQDFADVKIGNSMVLYRAKEHRVLERADPASSCLACASLFFREKKKSVTLLALSIVYERQAAA